MSPGTDLLGISSLNSNLSVTIYETETDEGMMTGLQLLVPCVPHDMGTPGSAGLAPLLKCLWLHRKIKIKKVEKGQ